MTVVKNANNPLALRTPVPFLSLGQSLASTLAYAIELLIDEADLDADDVMSYVAACRAVRPSFVVGQDPRIMTINITDVCVYGMTLPAHVSRQNRKIYMRVPIAPTGAGETV